MLISILELEAVNNVVILDNAGNQLAMLLWIVVPRYPSSKTSIRKVSDYVFSGISPQPITYVAGRRRLAPSLPKTPH